MNTGSDISTAALKRVWIAALLAFVVVFTLVLWASSSSRPVRTGVEDDPVPDLASDQLNIPPPRVAIPPPVGTVYEPPTDRRPAKAVVSVRPSREHTPASSGAGPSQVVERERDAVRDMFPVGRVLEKPLSQPRQVEREPAAPDEGFVYQGKQWTPTGETAPKDQVDLAPAEVALDQRQVYALSGSGGEDEVLFVQSDSDPGTVAIYRPRT